MNAPTTPNLRRDLVLVDGAHVDLDRAASWTRVRVPGLAADWPARADALLAAAATWEDAGLVLVLSDDVEIAPEAVTELFRLMRTHGLRLAQPSLAWRSHFTEVVTLHNPSFAWRHTSRVDPSALAFDVTALRRVLALAPAAKDAGMLGWLLPAAQDDPARGVAVVDAVQAVRTAEPAPGHWVAADGPAPVEAGLTWGGLGVRGQRVDLFDETREQCLGLLTAGCACAVQEPQVIGDVFLQHFLRSLESPPASLAPAAAAPAPEPAAISWRRVRRAPIVP